MAPDHHSPRIRSTPRARRLMRERGLDASRVVGSGPSGRIVASDVASFAAAGPVADPGGGRRVPLSPMRRAIARRLVESKQTIPHFYLRQVLDAGPAFAFYQRCKSEFPCSLNDVVMKAAAQAVREFPAFRTRFENDELVELDQVNLGLAVGLEDGLVVPTVLEADRLEFQDLARETRRLVDAARVRRVENVGRSVFTVSNLGMFGVEEFTAIVNPPEAAILAVGTVREAALVRGGALSAGRAMTLTLSCDHRIIDGLCAAKFMGRLQALLSNP